MKAHASRGQLEEALRLQRLGDSIARVFANAHANHHASKEGTGALQLETLAKLLNMPTPQRIEAYDVANISGTHAVGAMVVFTAGEKDSSQYRAFTIRDNTGGDVGMMREMITRRLTHTEWPMPDLILVDGAQGQVGVARQCLKEINLSIPVVGVVKNERHRPVRLQTATSSFLLASMPTQAARLVARIDEEAHRFSLSKYRARHRASIGKRRASVLR
jgi:excinuclease ABC subunit C